jgi:hypothetical protein
VLAAFFSVIDGITAFQTVERNPNWVAERPALPCAAVFDGPERAEEQNTADMLVTMNVAVEITVLESTVAAALSDLNDKLGLIRVALAADKYLGGTASHVRYLGCDEPQSPDLTASACEASLEINFEVERLERHASPYT